MEASSSAPSDQAGDFIRLVDGRLNFETQVVLVVDDEVAVRELICKEIKAAAPQVLTVQAGNGRLALEKLTDIRTSFKVEPVLMVVDLKMPGMDGWELLTHLRKDYEAAGESSGTPVIVLSSTSGEKRAGFSHHTVHGGKADYAPLISVAKEDCVAPLKYDAAGREGLTAWVRHFLGIG